jgi:phage major head subunit gpT-like protein
LDGKTLFHGDHKNYMEGADTALTTEGLRKAVQMFLDQVDADGQPINIEPMYLVVPTGLKHTAIELTKGATLIMSGGAEVPTIRPALNVLADENLQVVSAPHLSNNTYPGYSAKAWYLFGNSAQTDTFEIGYLRGKRTPTVETGDTDFNTLGQWFRVYFDLGVREQDHRGMVKSKGE